MKNKREIKFRIWDEYRKRYVDSNYDAYDFEVAANPHYPLKCQKSLSGEFDGYLDNTVIEQFTGLQDKRGNDIYEGDIVRASRQGKSFLGEVYYSDRWAQYEFRYTGNSLSFYLCQYYEFKVVGNINENPKLMSDSL